MNKVQDDCEGIDMRKLSLLKENCNSDDEDVINAYLRQRSNSNGIFKQIESDTGSESSLGVLDVDNLSELEKLSRFSNASLYIKDKPNVSNAGATSESIKTSEMTDHFKKGIFASQAEPSSSEMNLMKQRELAKRTLMQLNKKLEILSKNIPALLNNDGKEVDSKNCTTEKKSFVVPHLTVNDGKLNNIFDKNQSPQTPMFFRDELNSMNESPFDNDVPKLKAVKKSLSFLDNDIRVLATGRTIPADDNDGSAVLRSSDFTFESHSPGEIINRFEEDEKKFIKEQSAISNNSKLSHFSGIMGEETSSQMSLSKEIPEVERISIGKYFELRSHSINSLIGAKNAKDIEEDPPLISTPEEMDLAVNVEDNELKGVAAVGGGDGSPKNMSKRWYSTCELRRISEASSHRRHSNESSASTSTLLIQNLLCGMDSGLSGTQINDRLIECVNKIKNEKKNEEIGLSGNVETPKTSKAGGRFVKSSGKGILELRRGARDGEVNNKNVINPTERKKSAVVTQVKSSDFKENIHKGSQAPLKTDKSVLTLKNEHAKIETERRGFDSSTPKLDHFRSQTEKFKSACSKLLISDKDWEPPRVSSIRKPLNVNEDTTMDESEKTLVMNSISENSKISNGIINKESTSLEDTIALGDMTILSERIVEMQSETSILKSSASGGMDVVAVVQELSKYPKGSIDCSALTPIIRDQYPQLLSRIETQVVEATNTDGAMECKFKDYDLSSSPSGGWVNMPSKYGFKDHLYIPVDVRKVILTPMKNTTKDCLIVSIESLSIQCLSEKYLSGEKVGDEFSVGDFLSVYMKDTLIPPGEITQCKIHITPKVPTTLNIKLKLCFKKLKLKEAQTQDIIIRALCIFPRENITITPKNEINFGTIPEECVKEETVQIDFDGICDLPLIISMKKSQNFILCCDYQLDGEGMKSEILQENKFHCTLKGGRKRELKFKIKFKPCSRIKDADETQMDFREMLSVYLDGPAESCILYQIPILGSIGYARFLCNPSCSPLIFRTTEIGQPATRSFPLKNVGAVDIDFSIYVVSETSNQVQTDDLFLVPKTFSLPKNEERSIDIIFSGKTKGNYIKRYLILQMQPNGKELYDVELIGVVMPPVSGKSVSRFSSHSGPVNSVYNVGNIAFKLKTTSQSLSWAAVPLDVELKQTFNIMNTSSCNAVARFSFRKVTSSFKFLNDNGEPIEKLRKVLKPNCSNNMSVVFRPDSVGPHFNAIMIETNHLSGTKMIYVNGYGGSPKIFIRNLKSDLNGCKIVRLVNSEPENQIFHAALEFVNKGNIPGFVSIKTMMKVLSVNSELQVEPANFVLQPNSKIGVEIYQKVKNDDLKRILGGRDIGKLATIAVTTGDEISRLRMRKLVTEKKIQTSDSTEYLLNEFLNEKSQDIVKFDDEKSFENVFLKKLETTEIAAIIERPTDPCEPTMLEDFEDTVKEFVTILPAADYSITSTRDSAREEIMELSSPRPKLNLEKSHLSALSRESSNSRDRKIAKWLATIEKP